MTCIVGLVDNGRVWIGGDACAASEELTHSLARSKIWKRDHYIFGVAGGARVCDLLGVALRLPEWKGGDHLRYAVTTIVPAIRALAAQHGCLIKSNGEYAGQDGVEAELIIGFGGKLCYIGGEFGVTFVRERYASVGVGAQIAMGALYAQRKLRPIHGYDDRTAKSTITLALHAASEHGSHVRPPFSIKRLGE